MTRAKNWLASFNPKKTEPLLISHKLNKPVHPSLLMDNQVIKEVDSHKHLCVFLSNDCTWQKHIDYVKERVWGRMNVMRRLKYCLDRKSLETIYLTFIRPILEYADVSWDKCTNYKKQEFDKIQTEAARIVKWATKLVSLHALFDEVNWKLEARRMKHILLLLYKMLDNLSPEYLSSLIPPTVNNISRYSLRNANNIQTMDSRTTQYFISFCRLLLENGRTCHLM